MPIENELPITINIDDKTLYRIVTEAGDSEIVIGSVLKAYMNSGIVPNIYTKQTASGENFLIQKGQVNNLRLRPQIMNESAESSRKIQGVVTAGNIVGQIIKPSQDNINGLNLTFGSAAGIILDDFESYANDLALQAVWVTTGIVGTEADVEVATVFEGTQAMYLPAGAGLTGNRWDRTFTSTNFSGYTIEFELNSNKEYKDVQMRLFLEDSLGNVSSRQVVQANKNLWTHLSVPVDSLLPDAVTPADLTDIVKIGYEVEKEKNDGFVIIDALITTPPPGQVEVKLFDMGTDLPVSAVTALTDGTQYEKLGDLGISGVQASSVVIDLIGGKRMYHIDEFVAGVALEMPGNELLNKDHYYAITINYIDTDVNVYGPNEAFDNYYVNGYGFTTPAEATAITEMGANRDIQFVVFSTQEVYIFEITQIADSKPNGQSETTVYVEDENMKRTDVLVSGIKAVEAITTKLVRPFFMTKGAKLEQEYNDDFTDNVRSINLVYQYYFIPPVVNG